MMDIKLTIVRVGAAIFGLLALATGAKMVFQGVVGKLGESASALSGTGVLATLDNDFRFLAAIWLLVGLGLILGAVFIHTKADLVQLGLEAIILGGIARAFAMTDYGLLPQFYAPIAVELVVPAILLVLLKLAQRQATVPDNSLAGQSAA